MIDDVLDYLRHVRERPVWQPMPPDAKARLLDEPVPYAATALDVVYERFQTDIFPYPNGNIHPRYWAGVEGTGTVAGMLAELLAGAMNSNVPGGMQSAACVEQTVVRWFAELLGLPRAATGVLTSGGTLANLTGLAVARNATAPFDIRRTGLQQTGAGRTLSMYGSTETHSWAAKAADVLGIGADAFRRIACGSDYRIDMSQLRSQIAADRAVGCTPFCVIGNAGTVNTGAVDDLSGLAELCRSEGIWLHVDGAFGALAALSPALKARVAGIEHADSIAFDLHKWGYVQYDVGCVLVRNADAHASALAVPSPYLSSTSRGMGVDRTYFYDRGVPLSRSFRALKVWMSLRSQGVDAWGRAIQRNVEQARYLAALISQRSELELLAPVSLNIVCFRYSATGPSVRDALNREILSELHMRGVAGPSGTMLQTPNGRHFAIRAAIVNHRSRTEDFEALVSAVVAIGSELTGSVASPVPDKT